MNWKNEAIEKLENHNALCRSVKNISDEIRRLEIEAQSLRSPALSVVGSGGGGRKSEDRLLNNIAAREELALALEQAKLQVQITTRALTALDTEDRRLLEAIYVNGGWGSISDLAAQLEIERSSIYRRRDEALRKFTLTMYGKS